MTKVYLDELEEKGHELVNYSKNDITLKIDNLKNLTQNFVWKGLASEKYINEYNVRINKLTVLNNNVAKIAEFLVMVKENYTEANNKINNVYEELKNNLEKMKGQ